MAGVINSQHNQGNIWVCLPTLRHYTKWHYVLPAVNYCELCYAQHCGRDIPILYYVRNHNKISDFIFDPEKSVVLFSHPTQPTHEFGGPGQAQNGSVKRAEIFILKGRELFMVLVMFIMLLLTAVSEPSIAAKSKPTTRHASASTKVPAFPSTTVIGFSRLHIYIGVQSVTADQATRIGHPLIRTIWHLT